MNLPALKTDFESAKKHASLLGEQTYLGRKLPGGKFEHRFGLDPEWISARDTFITVNEIDGRRKNVKRWRAVWVEDDKPGPLRTDWPLEPSIIVESSLERRHYYWLTDMADGSGVMGRLVADYGCDSNAADAARMLRLAGSWSYKRGAPCRLISAPGHRYTEAEIVAAFPPIEVEKHEGGPAVAEPERATSALLAIPNTGTARLDREAWLRYGMAYKAAGGTLEAFLAWTADPSKERETRTSWKSFKVEGGIGPGTLYKAARDHGWIDPTEQGAAAAVEALAALELMGEGEATATAVAALLARISMAPSVAAAACERVRVATGVDVSPYNADGFEVITAGAPRFPVISAAEFARIESRLGLIKHLLPRHGLAMIFGASGSGKSFAAADIALAVARGHPWRGLKTIKGRVVYIVAEGAAGFRKRLLAAGGDLSGLDIIAGAPNLLTDDWREVAESIGAADLVIVDTLAQTTTGADENSAQDMGRALANLGRLQAATGGLVLVVHHSGKNSDLGARGSSSIHAAMDAVFEVTRNGDDRELRVRKQKDGEDDAAYPFKLRVVVLGEDEDGEEITSCVVEHIDRAPRRGEPTGDVRRLIFRAVPGSEDEVLTRAVEQMPHDPSKRDQRRARGLRALQSLIADRWVVRVGTSIYHPNAAPMPESVPGGVLF